ncbi:transcriptional regulator TetR [Acidisphaera rubrifaciens HS-AP3]|uniref:Transcriptional regulator TetR n=2 Tax=Acidisphaera TaxID=50714 RepID=A0A0D6P7V3_9PROT|nr:transcriptional regulator TetR [Acidisphaera rubrifaciens HS-AP3]
MKVSRQQAEENREAIVRAASARVREQGLSQMSGAEVAKAVGLTHGALYSHFASKEALVATAIERAYAESVAAFAGLTAEQFVERYLSPEHRDDVGAGCPSAALLSEVQRQPEPIRIAFSDGVTRFARLIGDRLHVDPARDERVLFAFAAMVGGLAIARAIRDQDPATSDAMLRAVASQLKKTVLRRGGRKRSTASAAPRRPGPLSPAKARSG